MLAPVEMDEIVSWPSGRSESGPAAPSRSAGVESISGKARYTGFRRLVTEAPPREREARP